jgi:queuine/archaeosine tRNA-ribosyltransferase
MDDNIRYRAIHLLGTGNPITLAILAAAGADVFDGLEWCRTAIDHDTARLHHPQHFDFFMDHCKFSEFENVRTFTSDTTRDFRLRLLVHNLDFFHRWMTDLRSFLECGRVKEFLGMYLSEQTMAKLESSLPEVIK